MIKKIILTSSIFFLIIVVILGIYRTNNMIFNKNIISEEEFNKIISRKQEYKGLLKMKFNNNYVPYDKTNNYYLLSQIDNNQHLYIGNLFIEDFEIDILKPNKTKEELVLTNDNLVLLVHNEKYYKILYLKLTFFPVIKLDQNTDVVTIFDNDRDRNTLTVQTYNMYFNIRGASSSFSSKPPYKLNIINSKGNKKMVTLLNMRDDDDWILNSMYLDKSYQLEKIGYNLWGNISKYNIELKYVELFIDNEYRGIYYLQDRADFKKYDANDKSLLISIKNWQSNIANPILFNENLTYNTIIDEFELDGKISKKQQIELLRVFASNIKGKEYSSSVTLNYDIESIANYSLFINLISAIDNSYKNQKVLIRYKGGHYYVELYPWDLDWSQNNEKLSSEYNFNEIVKNANVPKDLLNSEEYLRLLKYKYQLYRKSFYNEEYLFKLINDNKKELEKSGAILREENIWGERDLEKSVQILKNFYSERIKLLDNYYGRI